MMRTIIFTAGTSIFGGLARIGCDIRKAGWRAALNDRLNQQPLDVRQHLSAELSTLSLLRANKDDCAVFLATDTDDGMTAATLDSELAVATFGVTSSVKRIEALTLDDPVLTRTLGLPRLVEVLDATIADVRRGGRTPLLSISGGIKAVVPYVAIYGMLRHIPLTYVFEQRRTLLTLPQLPVAFDWPALRAAESALAAVGRDTALPKARLVGILGEDFARCEGLFQPVADDDQMLTLSAFGFLILRDFEQGEGTVVSLSPSAAKVYAAAQGVQRNQLDGLLNRIRNPLWRASHLHSFAGTDLNVYKPGRTAHRLAGWTGDGIVFVAELYLEHDAYETDLPARQRAQYDPSRFTPWKPQGPAMAEMTDEEWAGQDLVEQAITAQHRAETDVGEAFRQMELLQGSLAQMQHRLDETNRELSESQSLLAALRSQEGARAAWTLGRRLRWALSGS